MDESVTPDGMADNLTETNRADDVAACTMDDNGEDQEAVCDATIENDV